MIDSSRLIKDNPYYFNSADKNNNAAAAAGPVGGSPLKTPEIPSRGFASFFRRRSNSSKSLSSPNKQCNYVNEAQADQNQFGQMSPTSSFCGGQQAHQQHRGSFRSTLRSKSTNSSVTYSQGIIIGECRPNSSVSDSLKLSNLQGRQRLASYTESTFSYNSDDVFLPSSPAHRDFRAGTVAAEQQSAGGGHRRHSIGTFTNRLRGGSVSDEVPSMPAPKPPVNQQSSLRKGGSGLGGRCGTGRAGGGPGNNSATMDDILIVTARQSEPAILWANYLKTRFDKITKQRGRVPFNFLHVKLDETNPTSDIIQRSLATKLQIVVVCSALLKINQAVLMHQLGGILRPDKVLGLLLEVSEEQVQSVHRKCLPCYKQWKRCVVQAQDQNFVGHVLGIATDILGPALRDQPLQSSATQAMLNSSTLSRQTSTEGFTLLPKKVKVGQNKVVAILTEPLARDDIVQVRIDKTGEFIEVPNVKRRNPYTLQFNVPDECMEVSMMVDVQVIRNDAAIGCRPLKCESRLRELEQILRSPDAPMEFICQSMGVSMQDSNKLDLIMLQAFQKNIPPGFHLLATDGTDAEGASSISAQRDSCPEEYPTLLHFSARWGLDKLTMQLLECPGGEAAISMRNITGKTPLELAEQYLHVKCVEILKNFSQMHEFTTMYHYFKGVSDAAPNKVIVDIKSEMARKTSTVSQVLTVPQSPTLITMKKQPEYMEMNCNSSGGSCDTTNGASDGKEEHPYGPVDGVTNLNYINVEDGEDVDVCDGAAHCTEPETTNELQIDEPAYYESKDSNRTDTFSVECSNLLDNEAAATMAPTTGHPQLHQMTEKELQQQQQDLMSDYLIQPSNRPVTVSAATVDGFGDYLTHPSNKPIYDASSTTTDAAGSAYMNDEVKGSHMKLSFGKKRNPATTTPSPTLCCSHNVASADTTSDFMNVSAGSSRSSGNTLKRQESETSKASVDDELLEIINDFKNNVFTINEVEQLVSTWKNRNDVQQSFKDKEMQLQKMRHEYDRLQTQMKDHMKRPTPFERVRKLFSRSKSEDKAAVPVSADVSLEKFNTSGLRPPSSLSLHSVTSSTSSSGRLSTGSVCSGTSLGDSGTHSDHDERGRQTNFSGANCRVGTPGSLLMDNYMIPPAPRPVSTPLTEEQRFSNANEHYIIFPSNAPVFPQHDYINFGGCAAVGGLNTIDENKEADIHTIKIQKPKDVVYAPVTRKANPCSSFRNISSKAKADEEVMMRNQMQGSAKEMRDHKMFQRQVSSDTNGEPMEDHSYMNLTL